MFKRSPNNSRGPAVTK